MRGGHMFAEGEYTDSRDHHVRSRSNRKRIGEVRPTQQGELKNVAANEGRDARDDRDVCKRPEVREGRKTNEICRPQPYAQQAIARGATHDDTGSQQIDSPAVLLNIAHTRQWAIRVPASR